MNLKKIRLSFEEICQVRAVCISAVDSNVKRNMEKGEKSFPTTYTCVLHGSLASNDKCCLACFI